MQVSGIYFTIIWMIGILGIGLPIIFYLNFRLITLKCKAGGHNKTLGQRIIMAMFLQYPKAPPVQLSKTDRNILIFFAVLEAPLIITYLLANLGVIILR